MKLKTLVLTHTGAETGLNTFTASEAGLTLSPPRVQWFMRPVLVVGKEASQLSREPVWRSREIFDL